MVDDNKLTQHGLADEIMNVTPLAPKFQDFGWWSKEIDGHDYGQILAALDDAALQSQPCAVVCHTIKGKGISFMENVPEWHSRNLPDDLLAKALGELGLEVKGE